MNTDADSATYGLGEAPLICANFSEGRGRGECVRVSPNRRNAGVFSPHQAHFSEEILFSQSAQRSEPRSRSQTPCPLCELCVLGSVPSVKYIWSSWV